jgi:hypothetical protein
MKKLLTDILELLACVVIGAAIAYVVLTYGIAN